MKEMTSVCGIGFGFAASSISRPRVAKYARLRDEAENFGGWRILRTLQKRLFFFVLCVVMARGRPLQGGGWDVAMRAVRFC